MRELHENEPDDYINFLRMEGGPFDELLVLVTPLIAKEDTIMRDAITPFQRLSITLRYLATGNTFEDSKFISAISPHSIGQIVMETCQAIITCLDSYIKVISIILFVHVLCEPIIEFFPTCPNSDTGKVNIDIKADIEITAIAICNYGMPPKNFIKIDAITYQLSASLVKTEGASCSFKKKFGIKIYTIEVEVYIQDALYIKRSRTVMCILDKLSAANSHSVAVTNVESHIHQIRQVLGKTMSSTLYTLQLMTTNNRVVNAEKEVMVGQRVRLVAIINEATRYSGIQALDCKVETRYQKNGTTKILTHDMLNVGCGNGDVIDKNLGFWSEEKHSYSPFFEAFHFRGSRQLVFYCNFTVCDTPCDGDSCQNIKRIAKRNAVIVTSESVELKKQNSILIHSDTFVVKQSLMMP